MERLSLGASFTVERYLHINIATKELEPQYELVARMCHSEISSAVATVPDKEQRRQQQFETWHIAKTPGSIWSHTSLNLSIVAGMTSETSPSRKGHRQKIRDVDLKMIKHLTPHEFRPSLMAPTAYATSGTRRRHAVIDWKQQAWRRRTGHRQIRRCAEKSQTLFHVTRSAVGCSPCFAAPDTSWQHGPSSHLP
jgi:hypothetical protein